MLYRFQQHAPVCMPMRIWAGWLLGIVTYKQGCHQANAIERCP